ncbi:MAG: glycerophosphodiester phosphodiesterase family protein [Thermoplasmata archaeon]
MKDIGIIAHRGASALEPENSVAAFEKALEMGAHTIEMDVRTTLDGEAVLMHDETVNRTTSGHGRVSEMTFQEIKELRLRNREPVPPLKDVIERFKGRAYLILELKDHGSAGASCSLVKELKLWNDVTFSSFHGPWLVELKLRHPAAKAAFVSEDRKMDCVRIALSLKAQALHLGRRIATRKLIIQAHEADLDVNIWTVNTARQMRKFIEMGADGIITDKPDILIEALVTSEKWGSE